MTRSLQVPVRGPVLFLLVLAALALVAGAYLNVQYRAFLQSPLQVPEGGYVFQVEPGESVHAIIRRLETEGVTEFGWKWRVLARGHPISVHVGEYRLESGLGPVDLLDMLGTGRVVQHRFTILEGWTWKQLLQALGENEVLQHTLDAGVQATEVSRVPELAAQDLSTLEGWFLPETYYFVRGERDTDLLGRAHEAMRNYLEAAWAGRDLGVPVQSPQELLTLASIVEKETSLESERARIAGVFVRRLQKGMRLQTDPTVIYGMGDSFDGDIRNRDLHTDTPYNTYTRHGLPPTPIALPGKASIQAAAHPADGEELYFVANGEGGHTFSATLQEHEAAVKKLMEDN